MLEKCITEIKTYDFPCLTNFACLDDMLNENDAYNDGVEFGFQQGFEMGLQEGKKNKLELFAKSFLLLGIKPEIISKGIGLSMDKITEIQKKYGVINVI